MSESTTAKQLSLEDAMAQLSLSRAEVYRCVKDGKLKAEKDDNRLHFAESDVAEYAASLADERESLQGYLTHWLSIYGERLNTQGDEEMPDVSDEPAAEQVPELGRRIMVDCVRSHIEDLYLDPMHDGDRLIYSTEGDRTEPRRFEVALSTLLKEWFKSLVVFPETETPGIREALGQQTYDEKTVQFRVTVVPTLLGEHIHLHFFPDYKGIGIETIGYTPTQIEILKNMLKGRAGLILVTGTVDPSAEQHRLALAHELSAEGRLVVSLEHHVQYRSDHLVQLDVGHKAGVEFQSLWQSALDMRPDVIFFDECRDQEEAKALIEGVYSGAIVVAKIRAANAMDALGQLIRFELNRDGLAQVLLGVIERVVLRRMPTEGRQRRPATSAEAKLLNISEGDEIPTCDITPSRSDLQQRHATFGIWPIDESLATWIRTPDMPHIRQTDDGPLPVSLIQTLRQAVLAGEVAIEDARAYILP